jgi:hypothetical protein
MISLGSFSFAQQNHYEVFWGTREVLNARLYPYRVDFHPDVQPYYLKDIVPVEDVDSLYAFKIPKQNKFYTKALTENIFQFKTQKVHIVSDPLFDIVGGTDMSENKALFETGIGANIQADFFKKLSFGGTLFYHQSSFPKFLEKKIEITRVVPGQGYAYSSSLGGYDYLDYSGYISYGFLKYFTLEGGMGKNFWGDGYRSLFLSDAAYNYPYLKLTTNVWHIKLVNLYTNFKDMSGTGSSRWTNMENKYGAFHYLSWDISKRVNLGFFEAIIWQGKDTAGNRGFEISYLSPVIFFRPVEFSRGSPDNSLLGVSLRVKVGKKTSLYGQFLIDDLIFGEVKNGIINRLKHIIHPNDSTLTYGYWTNKVAWQLGVKSYDLFKIKNLSAQLEFNFARPYTYAHRLVIQNYGHYNQPLAHPAGANFWETCMFLRYNYKRWFFEGHFNYLVTGLDTVHSDFGQDIYKPAWDAYDATLNNVVVQPYLNTIGQGIKTKIAYYSLNVAYLLNPKNNLRFVLEYYYRSSDSELYHDYSHTLMLGLRMSITGRHYDF